MIGFDLTPMHVRVASLALRFAWAMFCVAGSIVVFDEFCKLLASIWRRRK